MATYVLMLTLNGDGRQSMLADPDSLLRAQNSIEIPGVSCLGLYGVLGRFDFVTILEAPDNDAAARFSLELGVRAGAHIETLPAVPIGHFHAHHFETFEWAEEPGDGEMTSSAG
jgi:uncharacterized protein with GYD domain